MKILFRKLGRFERAILWVWIAFTLLVLFMTLFSIRTDSHKNGTSEIFTNQQLKSWYDVFNEEYFSDQLPKDTFINWADLHEEHAMALTRHLGDGHWVIRMDRGTNTTERVVEMTILHESCHVSVGPHAEFDDHGSKFQNCMMGLALRGAFRDIW